ncbi:MAG: terpene cyclase/mutase family protein [Planctomycetaceae bacterium]|nr:terpene cyclase/mutase family protein [Planctomycetaceae bacterium]
MMHTAPANRCLVVLLLLTSLVDDLSGSVGAAQRGSRDILSPAEWEQLDQSIDRGLSFLATQQLDDGSFTTLPAGQPAVTSLCVMAFLSRGHVPGEGPHGETINRAIDFVLATQQKNGMLYALPIAPDFEQFNGSHTAIYNHAIAGMMLSEVYGMTDAALQARLGEAIIKALEFTRVQQVAPKSKDIDKGGWRYVVPYAYNDSDLSVTSWQLMFLRSAKNAEFDVPQQFIDEAMEYVRRCFDSPRGAFNYAEAERRPSGGIVGGGILSLALGGEHHSKIARAAGDWILANRQRSYNGPGVHALDRYHYSTYYCSQAMFQLGGRYWATYYPEMMATLIGNQRADGSWDPEAVKDRSYGSTYTTALAILALTPPYQILPIYQA